MNAKRGPTWAEAWAVVAVGLMLMGVLAWWMVGLGW